MRPRRRSSTRSAQVFGPSQHEVLRIDPMAQAFRMLEILRAEKGRRKIGITSFQTLADRSGRWPLDVAADLGILQWKGLFRFVDHPDELGSFQFLLPADPSPSSSIGEKP